MRWVVALGAALVGIAACTAFGSTDPETTTSSPEAGAAEAGRSADVDSGADGAPTTLGFCSGASVLFCTNFDSDPDAGVTNADDNDGHSSIAASVDAGRALVASIPVSSSDDEDVAFQTVTLPGVSDVRVEADVFFETVEAFYAPSASVNVIRLQYGQSGPSAYAQVSDSPLQQGVYVSSTFEAKNTDSDHPVPQNQWVHLVLEAGLISNGHADDGYARVTWNGGTAVIATDSSHIDGKLPRVNPPSDNVTVLSFGAARYGSNSIAKPFTVHVDNIVVTSL